MPHETDVRQLFIDLIVESGYLARERVEEVRNAAEDLSRRSRGKSFPEVMAERGYVDASAARRVWAAAVTAGPKGLIGNFRPLEHLRDGRLGRVFLAERTSDGELVALLIGTDLDALRRLGKAVKSSKTDGPGLARVLETGEADGQAFVAFEYTAGEETLAERLMRGGPLAEREALNMGLAIADALERIHRDALTPREVRPDNVLLRPDGQALLVEPALQDGYLAGDIRGLGATLFAALTGIMPPDSPGRPALADAFNPGVSRHAADAVGAMLSLAPEDRYDEIDAVRRDLMRVAEGHPPLQTLSRTVTEAEDGLRPVQVGRDRWNLPAVVAAAAGLLVFAIALFGREPADPELLLIGDGGGEFNFSSRREALQDRAHVEQAPSSNGAPDPAPEDDHPDAETLRAEEALADRLEAEEAEAEKLRTEDVEAEEARRKAEEDAETARLLAEKSEAERLRALREEEEREVADRKAREAQHRIEEELRRRQERFAGLVAGARVELNESRLDEAESLLNEAIQIRESAEVRALLRDVRFSRHVRLAEDAERAGDVDAALDHYRAARQLRDGLQVRAGIENQWRTKRVAQLMAAAREMIASGRMDEAAVELARAREMANEDELVEIEALEATVVRVLPASEEEALAPVEQETADAQGETPEAALVNSIGMAFVHVPAGSFTMGAGEETRQVHLDAYYIGMHEVTNAQFERFRPGHRTRWRRYSYRDDHPVIAVTWEDAAAFCDWLSELEGARYRLPTEAEWEKAARGRRPRDFPWGDGPAVEEGVWMANHAPGPDRSRWAEDGFELVAPVGSFPAGASPYGALDMAGNVWEWVADWFNADYHMHASTTNPPGPETGAERVLRGGSFTNGIQSLKTTTRVFRPPQFFEANVGFRCVREVDRDDGGEL